MKGRRAGGSPSTLLSLAFCLFVDKRTCLRDKDDPSAAETASPPPHLNATSGLEESAPEQTGGRRHGGGCKHAVTHWTCV